MKIPITKVVVANRIREELGDLDGLKKSIKDNGQINPLLVDPDNNLIAGERRLEAMRALGFTEVEVITKEQASKSLLMVLEIEENLNRKDFTDKEKIKAVLQLHRLKQEEVGESSQGKAGGWTLQKTAELLSLSKGQVSVILTVADALEKHEKAQSVPQVGGAPEDKAPVEVPSFVRALESSGVSAAYKELLHDEAEQVLAALEKHQEETKADEKSNTVSTVESVIANDDCRSYVKRIPTGTIHIVVTDPPYGVDYDQIVNTNFVDTSEEAISLMVAMAPELYRVCAENSYCLIFFGAKNMFYLIKAMESAGFVSAPAPFIWTKDVEVSSNNQPHKWLTASYELAWLFSKGSPLLEIPGSLGHKHCKPLINSQKIHPTQKPAQLIEYILTVLGHPTMNLFDPFAGSGTTLLVGHKMGYNVCGCELDKEYYTLAKHWMIESLSGVSLTDATLEQLGFSIEQIKLATDESKAKIIKDNLTPKTAAILADGSLMVMDFGVFV